MKVETLSRLYTDQTMIT